MDDIWEGFQMEQTTYVEESLRDDLRALKLKAEACANTARGIKDAFRDWNKDTAALHRDVSDQQGNCRTTLHMANAKVFTGAAVKKEKILSNAEHKVKGQKEAALAGTAKSKDDVALLKSRLDKAEKSRQKFEDVMDKDAGATS
jgi:hypothetical protein